MALLTAEKSATVAWQKAAPTPAAMQPRASLLQAPNVPMASAVIALAAKYIPLNLLISADQLSRLVTCQKSAMASRKTVGETWRSKTELSVKLVMLTALVGSAMLAKSSANFSGARLAKWPTTDAINIIWTPALAETVALTKFVESTCPVRLKRTLSVGAFIARIEMKSSSMVQKGLPSSQSQSSTERVS